MQNLILFLLSNVKISSILLIAISTLLLCNCRIKSEQESSESKINNDYNLIFTEHSKENIPVTYYSISSHEQIVIIDNKYIEIGIVDELREGEFIDISNNLNTIETLYPKDSTLLDTYLLSIYKSFLLSFNIKNNTIIKSCNIDKKYMDGKSLDYMKNFFYKKGINSEGVFNYNNIFSFVKMYESEYCLIIVFIEKRKIIPIFVSGDSSIVKINAYALLKSERGINNLIMIKELLKFDNCTEESISLK